MNHIVNPGTVIIMELLARDYDVDPSEPTVLMHPSDCARIGVREGDRVRVAGASAATAIVSVSDTVAREGEVLVPPSVSAVCGPRDDVVDVTVAHTPESVRFVRDKMEGRTLTPEQISQIVEDTVAGRLSRVEIAAWLTALYINGMDTAEIAAYAESMAETGDRISFDRPQVFDFHSFGGLPGNKITPIVVSIAAAAGLTMPKLSSRAISSACGTADFVETFCRIDLGSDEVRRVSEDVGGVFSWTGATDLGPAGDRFITVQRPLGIDPRPQLLASIMSKKVAAGATDLVMDIPMGTESKVPTLEEARSYARDLMDLGERLGMRVECAITYAEQPLGCAVGPVLEARECMQVLEGLPGSEDVADKACICAGMVLEMGGFPDGNARAMEILASGEAHRKFLEIVEAQGGSPDVRSADMVPGRFSEDIVSDRSGFVKYVSNRAVVAVAKAAGAPSDKGAGLVLGKKLGMKVSEGDVLMTVYADREDKLRHAVEEAYELEPVDVDGMVIGRIGRRDR